MQTYNKLKKLIEEQESDIKKIEKGQGTAARRVREAMQEIRVLAKQLRQDVQDTLKNIENNKTDNFQP